MHAPHHVPQEWADKYKGQFDDGWDAYREKVFTRQKELGVIRRMLNCRVTIPTLSPGMNAQRWSARSMRA